MIEGQQGAKVREDQKALIKVAKAFYYEGLNS